MTIYEDDSIIGSEYIQQKMGNLNGFGFKCKSAG